MNNLIPLKGLNILLIDDEEMINEVNKALLEKAGAKVKVFKEAIKAVKHLEVAASDIDVVISDFQMPGDIKGDDIYRLIQKKYPLIRCIILTGFISKKILGVPIENILQKPIAYEHLIKFIAN